MELKQLEYFITASKFMNITKAAEELYVSQPNISTAISKLEAELDIKLFDRSQKKISHTTEGYIFYTNLLGIFKKLDDAILEINDMKNSKKGTIKVGIPPMIGSYLFPKIFSTFNQQHPNIKLSIIEEGSLNIRKKLDDNEIDLGILILKDMDSTLNYLKIIENEIVICVPLNHPLAKNNKINIEDLAEIPLIMLKDDSYHRQIILAEFAKAGIKPNIILSSNQIETIKNLVSTGVGISFLFNVVLKDNKELKTIKFEDSLTLDIGLAWKKDNYLSKSSEKFISFVEKNF